MCNNRIFHVKQQCFFITLFFLLITSGSAFFQEFPQLQLQSKRFPTILNDDTNRIIGGHETIPHEYPSTISVQYYYNKTYLHTCTGSIVNEKWILTAGHCSTIGPASKYRILAGGHNLLNFTRSEQIKNVEDIQTHPKYSLETIDFDIAMMMITDQFEFNEYVKPALLAPESFNVTGTSIAAGWGLTKKGSQTIPANLQKVILPIVEWNECKQIYDKYQNRAKVTERMICAGGEQDKNVCQGDSGGPLFSIQSERKDLILSGLTSWGLGCADYGWPGVFTNVSYFHTWIQCIGTQRSLLKVEESLQCLIESGEKLLDNEFHV